MVADSSPLFHPSCLTASEPDIHPGAERQLNTRVNTIFYFKLGLLVFWGVWYLIAFSTNLCECFERLRILPKAWPFASGNFRSVTQAVKMYSASQSLPWLLFAGVLSSQLLVVLLFGWAIISSAAGALNSQAVNAAFIAGIGLWAAFMLADEIFKQYDAEHSHVLFFIAQLVTFISVYMLPS